MWGQCIYYLLGTPATSTAAAPATAGFSFGATASTAPSLGE